MLDDKLAALRRLHRLERVAEQIDQHLLNLDAVGQHQIDAGMNLLAHPYALFAGADKGQGARLLDNFDDRARPSSRFRRAPRNRAAGG